LKRIKRPLISLLLISAGILAGWWGHTSYDKYYQIHPFKEKHGGQYELINPLLECEGGEELISGELKSFRDKMEELINSEIGNKKATHIAVYFRDMNDGPWFGINEKEPFLPGSLLKIPIMMGYLKEAESYPGILAERVPFDRKFSPFGQYIRPSMEIEYGKSYTIEELIYRMVVYSDNYAALLLRGYEDERIYGKVFTDLDITAPTESEPFISVKKYASFFRILFNASYLDKEASNTALKMLKDAEFRGGLVAGIPSNLMVAHKFGESKLNNEKQFHDCGIVYYPKNPYLLCVMSRGENYGDLVSAIKAPPGWPMKKLTPRLRHNQ